MRKNSQAGSAMVESLIVIPILLLVFFAICDIGIMVFNKQVITNAAREATRAGIVLSNPRLDSEGIKNIVTSYCSEELINFNEGLPLDDTDIEVMLQKNSTGEWIELDTVLADSSYNISSADSLRVNLDWDYHFFIIPNFIASLGDYQALHAGVIMRYE